MNYVSKGTELRRAIEELVLDYMSNSPDCGAFSPIWIRLGRIPQCNLIQSAVLDSSSA